MDDFIAAVGLVFFIEGLLFAAFPAFVRARILDVLESCRGGDWTGDCFLCAAILKIFPFGSWCCRSSALIFK